MIRLFLLVKHATKKWPMALSRVLLLLIAIQQCSAFLPPSLVPVANHAAKRIHSSSMISMSLMDKSMDRRSMFRAAVAALIAAPISRVSRAGADAPRIGKEPRPPPMVEIKYPDDGFSDVRRDLVALIAEDRKFAPTLVRLGFHTSGTYDKMSKTGGSSKGTIRFKEEIDREANAGLKSSLERLEPVKAKHPEISYADLYTLAGCIGVETLGGPQIPWKGGRKDSMTPKDVTPEGRLPDPDMGTPEKTIKYLRDIFGRMGFNDQELVALSGAHTIGQCHWEATSYVGVWSEVPLRFDNAYFNILLQPTTTEGEDPVKEWTGHTLFGKLQYGDELFNYMMLPSDLALIQDKKTLEYVKLYANNAPRFFKDFAAAYGKLLALGTDQGV